MFKATVVFCLLNVQPCTQQNATYVKELGEYQFCPHATAANIRQIQALSVKRGNTEYFQVLCEPK